MKPGLPATSDMFLGENRQRTEAALTYDGIGIDRWTRLATRRNNVAQTSTGHLHGAGTGPERPRSWAREGDGSSAVTRSVSVSYCTSMRTGRMERVIGFEPTTLCLAIVAEPNSPVLFGSTRYASTGSPPGTFCISSASDWCYQVISIFAEAPHKSPHSGFRGRPGPSRQNSQLFLGSRETRLTGEFRTHQDGVSARRRGIPVRLLSVHRERLRAE